jgi:putative membrane protein
MGTKVLLYAIVLIVNAFLFSCGDGTGQGTEQPKDSQMVAEHVDPSTKFPQQLIEEDTLQSDKAFVENAVQSGKELTGLAQLAVQKARQASVKQIAGVIVRDHGQWVRELEKLEKPAAAGDSSAMSYTDKSREELEKLSGADFDRQWVDKMITKHAAMISRYEAESAIARDKEVRNLVNGVLPKIKQHQQQLEACRAKLQ